MSSARRPVLLLLLVALGLSVVAVLLRPPAAIGRALAVPVESLVEARLVGVGQVPGHPMAVVLLRVDDEEDPVAIFVGLIEAAAILRARDDVHPARPLTHELSLGLLEAAGARVQRLVVDEMRDGAYLAALEIQFRDRRDSVWIDARPSDGLALAVRHDAQILLSPEVIAASSSPEAADPPPDATLTADDPPGSIRL